MPIMDGYTATQELRLLEIGEVINLIFAASTKITDAVIDTVSESIPAIRSIKC